MFLLIFRRSILLFLILILGVGDVGVANSESAPGKTQSLAQQVATQSAADPSVTTSAYGDWVLRCVKLPAAPDGRACEIIQSIVAAGQSAPVSQIALGRVAPTGPLQLTLLLPSNVMLTTAPRLTLGATDQSVLSLAWQKCLPGGCFASAAVDAATLASLKKADVAEKISVIDGTGSPASLPFSAQGLSDALAALAKSN